MSDDRATTMEREPLPRTGRPSPATPEPEAPTKPANGGRRRTVFLIMGVILLALIGVGVRRWIFGLSHVSTDNAQVDGHIIPILPKVGGFVTDVRVDDNRAVKVGDVLRSEEHTSELQSLAYLVCRLLLEKKKKKQESDHND